MMDAVCVGPLGPVHNDSWNSIITSRTKSGFNTSVYMVLLNIPTSSSYHCIWKISSSNPSVLSVANTFQFQLLTTGNNFRSICAYSNQTSYMSATPQPSITIFSTGMNIAGSAYSLVCTVKVVDGLVVVPDVVWMKDGRVLVNGTNTTLTRTVSGANSTLNLTFNPLLTSHGGQYVCISTIFLLQLQANASSNVTVQSKCVDTYQ